MISIFTSLQKSIFAPVGDQISFHGGRIVVDASADRFQDQLKSILFVEKQQPSDNVVRCVSQIADYDAHYVSVVHVEQRDDLLDDDDGVEGDNEQPVIEVAKRVIFEFHPAPRKVNTHKKYGKIVVADIFFHEKLEVYITCMGFRGCTSIITGCVYVALLPICRGSSEELESTK